MEYFAYQLRINVELPKNTVFQSGSFKLTHSQESHCVYLWVNGVCQYVCIATRFGHDEFHNPLTKRTTVFANILVGRAELVMAFNQLVSEAVMAGCYEFNAQDVIDFWDDLEQHKRYC